MCPMLKVRQKTNILPSKYSILILVQMHLLNFNNTDNIRVRTDIWLIIGISL